MTSEVGRARKAALVFETDSLVRRVRYYPAHWRDRSDAELAGLMATA